MFTYLIPILIFVIMMIVLLILNIKDSIGKVNNALLAYYIAISMFVTLILSTLITSLGTEGKVLYPPREFYQYSLYFVLALGGIYVVRRQDWWNRLIDGIRSWKSGHPKSDAEKSLVDHAIKHPKDRDWVVSMLYTLKMKGDVKPDAEEGIKDETRDMEEGTEAFPVISKKSR